MKRAGIKRTAGVTVGILLRQPPASHFHRISGIFNVQDTVDQPFKSPAIRGQVDIASAIVHKAVHTHGPGYSIIPIAQPLWVDRIIFQTIDGHAVGTFMFLRINGRAFHKGRAAAAAVRHNKKVIRHLNLRIIRCNVYNRIYRCKVPQQHRIGRVSHIGNTNLIPHRTI